MNEDEGKALAVQIDALVAQIVGSLAGKPEVIGASALAGVVATWLAQLPEGDRVETLRNWLALVQELVGFDVYQAATAARLHS